MDIHPLVNQLRFTRTEFVRCLGEVSPEDAVRRVLPLNSISWTVGHLANQEQTYWVQFAQGKQVIPGLNDLFGYGKPASAPPLAEMWAAWHGITQAADVYLDTLTTAGLEGFFGDKDKPRRESIGTMLLRNIYHYWYHLGEAHAMRDMLGHSALPQFVGNMAQGAYCPET